MSTQPRKDKGTPAGGEFDHKVHGSVDLDLDTSIDGDDSKESRSPEERWKDRFSPGERAVLTRAGVGPEWMDVVDVADARIGGGDWQGHGILHRELVEIARSGRTPDEVEPLVDRVNIKRLSARTVNEMLEDDLAERGNNIDPAFYPLPDADCYKALVETDADHDLIARVYATGLNRYSYDGDNFMNAVKVAEAGVDEDVLEATGSGEDYWRAYLCRTGGEGRHNGKKINEPISDEEAARWKPLYPVSINQAKDAGWTPDQARDDDLTEGSAQGWYSKGIDPTTAVAWSDAGYDSSEAASWVEAGYEPSDAQRWHEFHPKVSGHEVKQSGLTLEEGKAMSEVMRSYHTGFSGCVESFREHGEPRLRAWSKEFGRPMSPAEMRIMRNDAKWEDPTFAKSYYEAAKTMPSDMQRDIGYGRQLGFMSRHVAADEIEQVIKDGQNPLVLASARSTGKTYDEAAKSLKDNRSVTESMRAFFGRRRIEPEF